MPFLIILLPNPHRRGVTIASSRHRVVYWLWPRTCSRTPTATWLPGNTPTRLPERPASAITILPLLPRERGVTITSPHHRVVYWLWPQASSKTCLPRNTGKKLWNGVHLQSRATVYPLPLLSFFAISPTTINPRCICPLLHRTDRHMTELITTRRPGND